MTEDTPHQETAPIPADKVGYLIATAARAPSVHNTQPWRFKVSQDRIELYADLRRRLRVDTAGREMLISCGAALFGLRLAIRSLGYQPVTELLPDPARPQVLARVRLGRPAPASDAERRMLEAIPHRHTHRGPFAAGPLPEGLLAGLQHDALAEGATLVHIEQALSYQQLADIVNAVGRRQDLDPVARAEVRRWTRAVGSTARDGVPALAFGPQAFPPVAARQRGRLRQRDYDLGRGIGLLVAGGPPAAATVALRHEPGHRPDVLVLGGH
jgi:nitroreductase